MTLIRLYHTNDFDFLEIEFLERNDEPLRLSYVSLRYGTIPQLKEGSDQVMGWNGIPL